MFSAPVPKLLQAEMEIGYLSLPVTQLTYDDPLSTTHAHVKTKPAIGGGATTLGGRTAIAGGGTPDTCCGTPFRSVPADLTTGYVTSW